MSEADSRILLIEDAAVIRRKIMHSLRPWALQFLEASDGSEGYQMYQAHQDTIGLIVLDIDMPHQDGVQTLQQIRQLNAKVPVLMCSGKTGLSSIMECARLGANDFLRKPFEDHVLHAKVLKFLPWLNNPGNSPRSKATILLIEGEELRRELFRWYLTQNGLKVNAASSLERAGTMATDKAPEIILLNTELYEQEKLESLQQVLMQSSSATDTSPAVLGYSQHETSADPPNGVTLMLQAPFDGSVWLRAIQQYQN